MGERKRPLFGPGEIIVLMIIGLIGLVVLTENYKTVLASLYSPYAVGVVVVMVVEYLLLKGSDRSAIYRRERDAAREIRRDDLLAMREIETLAVDLRARLAAAIERGEDAEAMRGQADRAKSDIESLIRLLRGRI